MTARDDRWRRLYLTQGAGAAVWVGFMTAYFSTSEPAFVVAGTIAFVLFGIVSWIRFGALR